MVDNITEEQPVFMQNYIDGYSISGDTVLLSKEFKASVFIVTMVISIIALILILVVFGISLYCTINSNKKSRVQYAEYELKKSIIDNLLDEIEKNETPQN